MLWHAKKDLIAPDGHSYFVKKDDLYCLQEYNTYSDTYKFRLKDSASKYIACKEFAVDQLFEPGNIDAFGNFHAMDSICAYMALREQKLYDIARKNLFEQFQNSCKTYNIGKECNMFTKDEIRVPAVNDTEASKDFYSNHIYRKGYRKGWDDGIDEYSDALTPKQIIYNPPATIVFWEDGDKTVVKCTEGEKFSKYFGFCAALAKRVYESNNRIMKIVDSGIMDDKTKKEEKTKKKESESRSAAAIKAEKIQNARIKLINNLKTKHYSYAQIANKLNLPESTVRNLAKKGSNKK